MVLSIIASLSLFRNCRFCRSRHFRCQITARLARPAWPSFGGPSFGQSKHVPTKYLQRRLLRIETGPTELELYDVRVFLSQSNRGRGSHRSPSAATENLDYTVNWKDGIFHRWPCSFNRKAGRNRAPSLESKLGNSSQVNLRKFYLSQVNPSKVNLSQANLIMSGMSGEARSARNPTQINPS